MKIIQVKPKKYLTTALIGFAALGAVLLIPLTACSSNAGPDPVRSSAESSESRVSAESGGGEQSSEHQGGSESGEHSSGAQSGAGGEESATQFTLTDTFDDVRAGARLILSYDAATNAFTGTVENTTAAPLKQVRVEVHLSNGTELGPTTPVDLAPGQVIPVNLPATSQPFATWGAHPEVGASSASGESGGGEQSGEHSSGGSESGEHSSGAESGEHRGG